MIKEFEDVRKNLKNPSKFIVETPSIEILSTLTFNSATEWTASSIANKVLEHGKIPPLGIKQIHEMGIDGLGVNVAIIDQPLALKHPEYAGKIVEYKTFAPEGYQMPVSSMHGPAVTSLLVGENIGVAPKAKVYYAAAPSWLGDAQYEIEALKWIMEINKTLDDEHKIKFVSVSAAVGQKNIRPQNSEQWFLTVKEAEKNRIIVVDCTEGNRFVSVGYVDPASKEFCYGFPNMKMKNAQKGEVHVPNSMRTIAESYDNENFSYIYTGVGGLSWGIPYAVGVLCLAQQIAPELSAEELKGLLIESAQQNKGVINPQEFLDYVKEKTFGEEV